MDGARRSGGLRDRVTCEESVSLVGRDRALAATLIPRIHADGINVGLDRTNEQDPGYSLNLIPWKRRASATPCVRAEAYGSLLFQE